MPHFLFAYRDNDLFRLFVPRVAEVLKRHGQEVEMLVFPRGVEVKADLDTQRRLRGLSIDGRHTPKGGQEQKSQVMYDLTVRKLLRLPEFEENTGWHQTPLDYFVGEFVAEYFCDELKLTSSKCSYTLDESKRLFQKAVGILAQKTGVPSRIAVNPKSLTDHAPFRDLHEPQKAHEVLASWIREIFPNCAVEKGQNPPVEGWLLVDRHARSSTPIEEEPGVFRLPVETGILDLASLGLLPPLEVSDAVIEKAILERWLR